MNDQLQRALDQARLFFQASANERILWNPWHSDYNLPSGKHAAIERIAAKSQKSREIVQVKFNQLVRTFLIVEPTNLFCGSDVTDIPQEDQVQQDEDLLSDTEAQAEANPGPDGQVLSKLLKIIEEGMKKDDNPTWPDLLVSYVRMMIQNAGNRPEAEMRRLQKTLIGVMENFQDGGMAAP